MDFASPNESDVDMMHDDSMLHVNLAAQYSHHHHHQQQHQQHRSQSSQSSQSQSSQSQASHSQPPSQQRSLHTHGSLPTTDPHSVFPGVYVPGLNHMDPQPQQGDAMEEYARLMGIKVESDDPHVVPNGSAFTNMAKIQANAAYFENLMSARDRNEAMDDGTNITSMTLPAGIGSGLNGQFMATPGGVMTPTPPLFSATSELAFQESSSRLYDPSSAFSGHTAPMPFHKGPQVRPSMLPPDLVGSQTLPPEIISAMIKNNPSHNFDNLSEDEKQALIKEEKSRERNRDHSRKSRLRKKEFVESLKHEVGQLQVYQQICEQSMDCIALVVAEASAVFLYSSAAYTRVLGYQNHQIVPGQTSFLDMVHPTVCVDV
uniref:PAS domain-containing protein n=1 Tax=Hyaloperonospora arabidopsidis (strain Emoy2) TaxID=559515 RepID=M4BWF2_HYAAE